MQFWDPAPEFVQRLSVGSGLVVEDPATLSSIWTTFSSKNFQESSDSAGLSVATLKHYDCQHFGCQDRQLGPQVKIAEKDDAKHSYRLVKDGKDFHVRVQRPVRSRV
jgi:hypothetical protein